MGTPPIFDVASHGFNFATPGVITVAHTVAVQANRALLIFVGSSATGQPAPLSVTYGGVAATLVGSVLETVSSFDRVDLYVLTAPPTGANNIVVTRGVSVDGDYFIVVQGASYYNVNQGDPFGAISSTNQAVGTAGDFSQAVTCILDGLNVGYSYAGSEPVDADLINLSSTPMIVDFGAALVTAGVTSRTPLYAGAARVTDDIEIAYNQKENNAVDTTASSGWNKLFQHDSSTTWSQSIYWRRYNGANIDPVITWTGSADAQARRFVYRYAHKTVTPVKDHGTFGQGTTTTHTSTGANTTAPASKVLYMDSCNANTALAEPAGWTEQADSGSGTGPNRFAMGDKEILASGGASGNISVIGGGTRWVQSQMEFLKDATREIQTQRDKFQQLNFAGNFDFTQMLSEKPSNGSGDTFVWRTTGQTNVHLTMAVCLKPAPSFFWAPSRSFQHMMVR